MPTFFRLAQTSCNLVSWASHFDVNVKKYKNPKYEFGTYSPVQDSVDIRVEDLVSNVDYLKNRCRNFSQKKYGRKRHLQRTNLLFSEL